jgi:hypothetical protein
MSFSMLLITWKINLLLLLLLLSGGEAGAYCTVVLVVLFNPSDISFVTTWGNQK